MDRKKKITVTVLVIILVIITIAGFAYYYLDRVSPKKQLAVICDKETKEPFRSQCFSQLALAKEDISICENDIHDQLNKDNCYSNVGIAMQDASICEKVGGQRMKNSCYSHIGERKGDTSFCEMINETYSPYAFSQKNNCYTSVASKNKDLDTCNKIQPETDRSECYASVAILTKDTAICDQIIHDDTWQSRCYKRVQYEKDHVTSLWFRRLMQKIVNVI